MPKVLLVEDNELNRDLLSRLLTRRGYEVSIATDGRAAISMASDQSPELILMDMSLPEIDGWEAVRILKRDASTAGIPIMALTAHAMDGDRQRAMDAGSDEYETKPIDLDRLLSKMTQLIDQKT